MCYWKLFFLFLKKKCVVDTQKSRLNETVLLSTHNKCLNCWVGNYSHFMLINVAYLVLFLVLPSSSGSMPLCSTSNLYLAISSSDIFSNGFAAYCVLYTWTLCCWSRWMIPLDAAPITITLSPVALRLPSWSKKDRHIK